MAVPALLLFVSKRRLAALCLVFCAFGFLRAGLVLRPQLPPEGSYRAQAVAEGMTQVRDSDQRRRVTLRDVSLVAEDGGRYHVSKAYLTYYDKGPLPIDGQRLSFQTRLYHPFGQMNPDGFDFRHYLLQRGIAVGLSGAKELTLSPAGQTAPASILLRARLRISSALGFVFGADSALPQALVIGDREGLEAADWEAFRLTGIAHVLAVSGLHVGLLAGGLLWLLARMGTDRRLSAAILTLFLLGYAALLGFSASVTRAVILFGFLMLGRLTRRAVDGLTALAGAFLIITIARPLDIGLAGFQLSFAAVLGLVIFAPYADHVLSERASWSGWVKKLISAYAGTVAAMLFTAPVLAWHFQSLSLVGLILSPVAVFLVGLIILGSLALLPFGLAGLSIAPTLAFPVTALIRLMMGQTRAASAWRWASIPVPRPSLLFIACAFVALFLVSRYTVIRWRWRALILAVLIALPVAHGVLTRDDSLRFIQLSGGNADAALLVDGHEVIALDTGLHGGDMASYLKARQLGIQHLIISHQHMDHLGGLAQLLERDIPIGQIWLPDTQGLPDPAPAAVALLDAARQRGIPIATLKAGDRLMTRRAQVDILWPLADKLPAPGGINERSLVTRFDLQGLILLSMGDAGGQAETVCAQPAHVVKLAHHGDKKATGSDFLSALSPQYALISSDDRAFSRQETTLKRLGAQGTKPLQLSQLGAVTIRVSDDHFSLESHLGGQIAR